jgi:hypothetical protein
MRFLRRGPSEDPLDAKIERFWAWWAGAKDAIAKDIPARMVARRASEISSAVSAIDTRLAWELAQGKSAQHMLVVTPEGSAEVRPIALAWLRAAPAADGTWEFHASRQPGEPRTLQVAGATVELSEMRAVTSWDESRELLSVRLWHPAFDPMPEQARGQIAFLFLDNVLGEEDVERWIGAIDIDPSAQAGQTPAELAAEVRRRAETATGDQWAVAQGTDDRGDPVIVRMNASIKRIDHPLAGTHLEVSLDSGLDDPDGRQGRANAAASEELAAGLAGIAIDCAYITDRRRRTIHFACEDGRRALEVAKAWADQHRDLNPKVKVEPDPNWSFRREYGV